MDVTSLFLPVRDAAAALPQFFNLANCDSLIVVRRNPGGGTTYLNIQPRPIIQSVSPRLLQTYEGVESIQIEVDDIQTQVSRRYSFEQLSGRGISYLIGAELVRGKPEGGYEADQVPGLSLQKRTTHWELLLRRRA